MKKNLILIAYILFFWILLPGTIVLFALWMDKINGFESLGCRSSGILILVVSLPLLTISILQFRRYSGKLPVSADPPDTFIRTGLYAVWRHPIYLFYTLSLIGAAITWGSRGMLLVAIPLFILLEAGYIMWEERVLIRRFGNQYMNYRSITPLIIPRLYFWLKIPCFLLFRILFSYRASGREHIPGSPPMFIISTHRNYLDPFFLAQAFPHPIRYVTTFEMFRKAKTRWFFRALDCIPKKRYKNDTSTGRGVVLALGQDAVIGVFPEGERIWSGVPKSLKPETLNLFVKFHHIPILPVRIRGNFFAWPRWGRRIRRANVKVEFGEPLHINPSWSHDRVSDIIREAIDPQDLDHPDYYCKSRHRFEKLQIVIYRCPLCNEFDTVSSGPKSGKCINCGAEMTLNERYHLTCKNEHGQVKSSLDEIYQSTRISAGDLESPKRGEIPEYLEALCPEGQRILAISGEMELLKESHPEMVPLLSGRFILTNRLLICANGPDTLSLPLEKISSVTTESNYKLQLYHREQKQLYQMVFQAESVLKWQDFIVVAIQNEFFYTPNVR